MIRVSVSGTHSVGKTILTNQLSGVLSKTRQVAIIPEVARILIDKGLEMNTAITEFGVCNYLLEYLRYERTIVADVVISDRSLIDLLAYISVNQSVTVRREYLDLVEEVIYMESLRFAFYIYLPIEFPMEFDGVRPADIIYQRAVDTRIVELLHHFGVPFHRVTGTIDERVDQICSIIDGAN